jgi:hypothetical protein
MSSSLLSPEERYESVISGLSSFCPVYVKANKLFLYTYMRKGALHLRADYDMNKIVPEFWRAKTRVLYSPAECRALGISEDTLLAYFNIMGSYKSSQAGMYQNGPRRPPEGWPAEFPAEWYDQIEKQRAHRYAEAKKHKHRCFSYIAAIRKRLRAALALPHSEILGDRFDIKYDKSLYR